MSTATDTRSTLARNTRSSIAVVLVIVSLFVGKLLLSVPAAVLAYTAKRRGEPYGSRTFVGSLIASGVNLVFTIVLMTT